VLGDAVLGGPSVFWGVISGRAPITSFLLYARPINPEVSALLLFAALLIFYIFFWKDRQLPWTAVFSLGFFTGGSFYISPYVSSFLFTFQGLTVIWFFVRKKCRHAQALLVSIGVGLVALVPFVLNFLAVRNNAQFVESSVRLGLVHTHAPVVGLWIIVLCICLFFWPRRYLALRPFFALSLAALVVLLNQQILTGIALQTAHYHWYITKPLVSMVFALYVVFLIEWTFSQRFMRGISYVAILAAYIVSAAMIQLASCGAHYAETLKVQSYSPVLTFLSALPSGDSVYADRDLSLYIPIYTAQDAPNNDYVRNYLVAQTYLENRLMLEYALRGIAPADALATMKREREDIAQRLFDVYWRDQYGSYAALPDALLEQYSNEYKKNRPGNITQKMKALGVSLVVWDRQSDPSWHMDRVLGSEPIFATARFELYRLATTSHATSSYK
jgi:hypothetical protein